uniref:26S proteasome regulatory particle assembly chaperone 1 n=1 Tax=Nilaparvata lugens TaxID=108931 RepID=A0A896M5Y1_NILLU|nr:26S proteasome regulatory particle assembly chaperone 1 [Nilaparvata lugens]
MEDAKAMFDEAYEGKFEAIKSRIAKDKDLVIVQDANQRTMLHWASLGGHFEIVKFLVDHNSPIDAVDDVSMTPLILAATAGRAEVVRYLLSQGAHVNAKNDQGHSPLQRACSKGWKEIVELLLKNDADVNIADIRGARPLHRAASLGLMPIVEILLRTKGIEVNVTDVYGNTPLHLSCEESRSEVALLLVKHGANVGYMNKESKTPLDLADQLLRDQIKKLKERGA